MDGVVMVSAFMAITLLRRESPWVLLMIHRQAMPHLEPRLTCPDGLLWRSTQPTLQVFGSPVSSSSEASQCPLLPGTMVFFAGMRTLLDGSVTSLPCAST